MNDKKMEILDRLIKDGAIDLSEALVLLETEKENRQQWFTQMIADPIEYLKTLHKIYPNPYEVTCTSDSLTNGMYGSIPSIKNE